MEVWELYNKKAEKTGIKHVRGKEIPDGYYHLVVECMTINSDNMILLTKRAETKPRAGMWECTGGSVLYNENSKEGVIRELQEETGLCVNEKRLYFVDSIVSEEYKTIYDLYVYYVDERKPRLCLQKDEVADAMWVTVNHFYKSHDCGMIDDGQFRRYEQVLRTLNMKIDYILFHDVLERMSVKTFVDYFIDTYLVGSGVVEDLKDDNMMTYTCAIYYLYQSLLETPYVRSDLLICFDKDYVDRNGAQHYEVFLYDMCPDNYFYELGYANRSELVGYEVDSVLFGDSGLRMEMIAAAIFNELINISGAVMGIDSWENEETITRVVGYILDSDVEFRVFRNLIEEKNVSEFHLDVFSHLYHQVNASINSKKEV